MAKPWAKELAQTLVGQKIVDISSRYPATDAEAYLELALALFQAGVFRIPIIGIKEVERLATYALFSNGIQEHHQLAQLAGFKKEDMAYTASLEGYPFSDFDPFYAYLEVTADDGKTAYQRLGRGSDYFPAQLSQIGIDELIKIFAKIGTLKNV